ncbi:MAG: molybdopterin molybdenumtransferase MoeA, partial [Cyanobacteria bacterium NC_groundwater_1444_Ag_S-0.65um_54_12]|nr:molybdopterin molybdenumtransferase MoeA [Cyanobacteria bacterium NC_groundwater_1444_Ag_S-0.65um_54_12]
MMISVGTAEHIIRETLRPLAARLLPLVELPGLVLAERLIAPDDLPPFANSAMDDYAVRS